MEHLLPYLAILACPISMGAMMYFMMRGNKEPKDGVQDPELERLYVAIGEPGLVCSFDTERLEQVESVETEQGAHTSCWDPLSQCLYVFCPLSGGAAVYEERAER